MSTVQFVQEAPRWLREFFGRENGLTWHDVCAQASDWSTALQPWLNLACGERADGGLVLPALDASGNPTWYVCADKPQDQDALAEQIDAFLGPALVVFDRTQAWTPATACERTLAERFPQGVRSFVIRPGASVHAVCERLSLLANLLLRRPTRTRVTVRPFALVRAEFDKALLTADEALARRCIDELRSSGRLNGSNERFLHVRLMAALGRDAAIVRDSVLLNELAETRLPVPIAVLRDVIEALYTVHLQPLDDTSAGAEAWLAVYARELRACERLLRRRRGLRSSMVLRTLFLQEVALGQGHSASASALELREELATTPDDAAWADRLLATLSGREVQSQAPVAPTGAPDTSEKGLASELVHWAQQPPSTAAAGGLLKAALELGTLQAAAQALAALRSYSTDLLQELSPLQQAMRQMLEQLVPQSQAAQAAPATPTNWTGWARWVASAAPQEEFRCRAVAEQGAQEWDHASWLADAASVQAFGQLLQQHAARLKPYLPLVQASLQDDAGNPLAQAGLMVQMATVVALEAPSPADLNLLGEWAAAVVRLGAGRDICEEMAGALRMAWDEVRSLRAFDWLCDVVEMLHAGPHSENGELQALFHELLGFAIGQQHRLSPRQHRMMVLLALDFTSEYTPPAPGPDDEISAPISYVGQLIGIYTLQESIVPHLRLALQESFPGCIAQFNHDHAGTTALEHLARHSNVMVFAWKCSKHQAFYCIQKNRPGTLPLLQPTGRGSASILRALEAHFEQNPPVH